MSTSTNTPKHAGHISMMGNRHFGFGGPRFHLSKDDNNGGGETAEQKAAREAAEKAEADRIAAEKAEADRLAAEKAEADRIATEKAEKDKLEADRKAGKLTDKEFELLQDVMKQKEAARKAQQELDDTKKRLASFDGVDPAKIKDLIAAQEKAEKDKRDAEKKAAEKAGDYKRLTDMMAEEHAKEVKAIEERYKAQIEELSTKNNESGKVITTLTVGTKFSNSKFIADELVLTPSIARQVYGPYCEIEGTDVVVYDKPAGEAARTKLVNGSGQPLPFDEAIKKLVETSPDRDRLLKSKLGTGAGSQTTDTRSKSTTEPGELRGKDRIAASLAAGALKKKTTTT